MRAAHLATFFIRPQGLLLAGAALLAAHPLMWLAGTWAQDAYNPDGVWVALAVLALAAWSFASEQLPGSEPNRRHAYALLALSALVRMAGQLLRVNVLGALTLSVDVYALGTLAGLHQRRRAVGPFWLALLFAFSLPLERVVQRIAGYALQQVSAAGACGLLSLADKVECAGQRLYIAGQAVLVDLPCSGAHGLGLALMLYAGLAALKRPRWPQALAGLAAALGGALLANMLRIALLGLGLAHAPSLQLMRSPGHEILGLLSLAVAALPLLWWARRLGAGSAHPATPALQRAQPLHGVAGNAPVAWLAALGFFTLAVVAVNLPARPLDVARDIGAPALPAVIQGYRAQPQPLTEQERSYFMRYGGGAARATYGPYALLVVSTAAPLRHLHAPDECLRGSGHSVRYVGLDAGALPTALYQSTDPQGQSWRVSVSYVSSRGEVAASIAQAVWLWLKEPGVAWTLIERIAPWDLPEDAARSWDSAALRSLDLPGGLAIAAAQPSMTFFTPTP